MLGKFLLQPIPKSLQMQLGDLANFSTPHHIFLRLITCTTRYAGSRKLVCRLIALIVSSGGWCHTLSHSNQTKRFEPNQKATRLAEWLQSD